MDSRVIESKIEIQSLVFGLWSLVFGLWSLDKTKDYLTAPVNWTMLFLRPVRQEKVGKSD
jgi:hypothetical protein